MLDKIIKAYVEDNDSLEKLVAKGLPRNVCMEVIELIHRNEYKRQQSAPGPRVSKRAFGKDWRFPISKSLFFR